MTGWQTDETVVLTMNWRVSSDVLTLQASCPHCLHDDAFSDLVVYSKSVDVGDAEAPDDGGPVEKWNDGKGLGREAFPRYVTVVCRCRHTEHAPADGCGRIGNVKTGR